MMTAEQLSRLEDKMKDLTSQRDRATIQMENVQTALKSEYKVDSIEEALTLKEKQEKQIEDLEEQIDKYSQQVETLLEEME